MLVGWLKLAGDAGPPHQPLDHRSAYAGSAPTHACASRQRPPRPKGLWQFSGASIDIHPIPFLFCSLMSNSHNVRATTARPLRKTSKGRSGPHGTTSRVAVPSPPPAGQGESLIHRGDEPQLTWDELFGLR